MTIYRGKQKALEIIGADRGKKATKRNDSRLRGSGERVQKSHIRCSKYREYGKLLVIFFLTSEPPT